MAKSNQMTATSNRRTHATAAHGPQPCDCSERVEALELLVARMATMFRNNLGNLEERYFLLEAVASERGICIDSQPSAEGEDLTDEDIDGVCSVRIPSKVA